MLVGRFGESAFADVMGDMSLVPLLGDGFIIYVPLMLVALCAMTLLGWWRRIPLAFDLAAFLADRDFGEAMVEEGRRVLESERRERRGEAA
jgi:hypothetical protein